MSKLIYAKSKAGFETAFTDKTAIQKSIVFMEDGYLWTHGQYFKLFNDSANPLFTSVLTDNTVTITDATSKLITSFNVGIVSVIGDSIISATTTDGETTLSHSKPFAANQTIGPAAGSNTTIVVPQITFSAYGHYSSVTNRTATLNNVLASNADATNTTHYLLGSAASTTATEAIYKTSKITFNPSNGLFSAITIQENGTNLASKYAPISHIDIIGSNTISGHVQLSDSTNSTSGVAGGIAATPLAVKTVMDAVNGLIAANDAMVFKGTIGTGGTITTLPTNNYQAGWTYKVITAGTYAGQACEIGDLIIAINDGPASGSTVINADWTVVQTNVDGSVTTSGTLTANQLVVGDGTKTVKTLNAGSEGQYLKIVSGVPAWANPVYRAININGTERYSASSSTTFRMDAGTGISLAWDGTNNKVTVNTSLQSLGINNSGTSVGSYVPSGTTNNVLNFAAGLKASLASNVFTVEHTNSITALTTLTLGKIKYDAQGHITGFESVSSLPNPTALTLKFDSGTTEGTNLYTYNGSTAKTIDIKAGTNVTLTKAAGVITINSQDTTYSFYDLLFKNATDTTVMTYKPATSPSKTIKQGANITLSVTGDVLTLGAINTWRDVKLRTPGASSATNIGIEILTFGEEFNWDATNKEVKLGWTEVAANGTVTYAF